MKNKRKINIPAAKFGLDKINGVAEALPGAIETLTNPFQTSTATTGKEAAAQSITDIGKGISSGASLGMAIGGPMGAGIGAIAGAATGLIGKKGSEAEMTSFTDYDEGSLGTGLIGAFGNKRLRKERKRIINNAYANRAAVQGTANLQNEWDETISAEYGGMIPESLVYADDGELINTPYGDINKIPEKGKPTDSNLLSLPEGSRILSNTLKVPGTKKTFAEMGDKLINKKKSKYTDKYSENSQKLNDMNNQIAYDNLFALQEELKKKKGIKPKTKQLVQAAQNGDVVNSRHNTFFVNNKRYNLGDTFDYKGQKYRVTGTNEATPISTKSNNTPYSETYWSSYDPNISWKSTPSLGLAPILKQINDNIEVQPTQINVSPVKKNKVATVTKKINNSPNSNVTTNTRSIPSLAPTIDEIDPMYMYDYEEKPLEMATFTKYSDKPDITIPTTPVVNNDNDKDTSDNTNTFDLSSLVSGISQLVPALSNIFTSKPKAIEANYNPYSNAILNTMRRRRYNINPALRDIIRNRTINNYNVSQTNTSTGANLAFALQSAINADKAIADIRAQESNINNQYLGEYANVMNNLGQQWVDTTNYAEDLNRKAQANARNIRRQGISQLSGILQNRELMENQKNRDNAMLALYKPFLEAGFTTSDLKNMLKYIRKGGNDVG